MTDNTHQNLPPLLAHGLALEAARTLFAMHHNNQVLQPYEVAIKMLDYYTEARKALPEEGKPPFKPPQQ